MTAASATDIARRLVGDNPDVPLPGRGDTGGRFRFLLDHTRSDIPVGRLVEAHLDATAILDELAASSPGADQLWGVWAAEPPSPVLTATSTSSGWRLSGTKPWCSGASGCTNALVTATVGATRPLFAVDLTHPRVRPEPSAWHAAGMARTDTRAVHFADVPAEPLGDADAYLERAGFWHGGIGVAACWAGGAHAVADRLFGSVTPASDELRLLAAGRIDTALATARALLSDAASEIDDAPDDLSSARIRALRVRSAIDEIASTVVTGVGRTLGPGPLVGDADHADRVADLTVYIRQSHGDRDLASLGRLLAEAHPEPTATDRTSA
ncbi:hypothetical protein [Gordonia soli]|uniref:Acyl-CoA oxidase/dehydrogenase middle domain-containing protein n=1 Tax=Gordonia soli NBRC 108243 TaxID=1223545 RepID=M0QFE3_9ACTN|nr:hypothetical protein [Gordonia soli]GAC67320.1 hypothetical protein GS4_07_00690 [Gordonia soli NBRC 108243]